MRCSPFSAIGFHTLIAFALVVFLPRAAIALPIFSQQYGVPCQKCHSAIPALNTFGYAFLNDGFHIPGAGKPPAVFPVAVKANLLYTSASGTGLPKAVVDEIEILTAGVVGTRGNYFAEQYAVDGGQHGSLREAWFNERLTPADAPVPLELRFGRFTLPVPVEPESFRETYNDYGVFVQTVGANPFNFKDPKLGISARFGHANRGLTFEVSALKGHDTQSGLPTTGTDFMQTLHELVGPFDLSFYRYTGTRDLGSAVGSQPLDGLDRFTRTGIGMRYASGRWTSESVLAENTDSNPYGLGLGLGLRSSGGFSQLRYQISRKLFGLMRYDGTNDDRGLARSTTALLGYRLTRNSRVTVEDVVTHGPATAHTLNTQFTIAY